MIPKVQLCTLVLAALMPLAASVPAAGPASDAPKFVRAIEAHGRVNFRDREDRIDMRVSNMTIENVAASLAHRGPFAIEFLCVDPANLRDSVTQRLSAPGNAELLTMVLDGLYELEFVAQPADDDSAAQATASSRVIARATGTECADDSPVLRTIYPAGRHPLFSQRSRKLSTEDFATVFDSAGPLSRQQAIAVLTANSKDPAVVALAIKALDDNDSDVSVSAARALGRMARDLEPTESAQAAAALQGAVRQRPFMDYIVHLSRYGKDVSWPFIEQLMASPDEAAVAFAIRALVISRDERGIEWLEDKVNNLPDSEQARQAMWAIARTRGPQAADALRRLLASTSGSRQAFVAQGMQMLEPSAQTTAAHSALNERLAKANERDIEMFTAAIGRNGFNAPLEATIASTTVADATKVAMLKEIRNSGTENLIPAMVAGLSSDSVEVRKMAASALSALAHQATEAGLLTAAKDADAEVRIEAIYGLTPMARVPTVTVALASMLKDDSPGVRKAAINAIARMDELNEEAEKALEEARSSKDEYVADIAFQVLDAWGVI